MTSKRGKAAADMADYHKLAKGWESDRIKSAENSKRIAWFAAGAAGVIAVAQGLAIFGLLPLKEVEPFVMTIDSATGSVDAVSSLTASSETQTEAVNKYMVSKYLRCREEYSRQLAEINYRCSMLMSSAAVGNVYHDRYRPEHPESPLRVYGSNATVGVRILNISFVAPQVASIRYEKTERRGSEGVRRSNWTATVSFRYSNAPMSEADRLVNPVGFVATDYRNDPEVGG